jgi:hypothetical protein
LSITEPIQKDTGLNIWGRKILSGRYIKLSLAQD